MRKRQCVAPVLPGSLQRILVVKMSTSGTPSSCPAIATTEGILATDRIAGDLKCAALSAPLVSMAVPGGNFSTSAISSLVTVSSSADERSCLLRTRIPCWW